MSNPYAAPDPNAEGTSSSGSPGPGGGTPGPAAPGAPGYGTPGYPPPPYGTPGYAPGPYGTPGYGPAAGYPSPIPAPTPTNELAVVALVLGLVGIVVAGPLAGIPAIIVGTKARRQIRAGRGGGDGMALAGVILGWIATALGVLVAVFVVGVILFAATTTPTTGVG